MAIFEQPQPREHPASKYLPTALEGILGFAKKKEDVKQAKEIAPILQRMGLAETEEEAIAIVTHPQFKDFLSKAPKPGLLEGIGEEGLTEIFIGAGLSPEEAVNSAKLYKVLSTGGQTAFAQTLFDTMLRRQGLQTKLGGFEEPTTESADVEAKEEEGFQFPPTKELFQNFLPFPYLKLG